MSPSKMYSDLAERRKRLQAPNAKRAQANQALPSAPDTEMPQRTTRAHAAPGGAQKTRTQRGGKP
eukprot:15163688-Alexandrium_andersonii.AAC.1